MLRLKTHLCTHVPYLSSRDSTQKGDWRDQLFSLQSSIAFPCSLQPFCVASHVPSQGLGFLSVGRALVVERLPDTARCVLHCQMCANVGHGLSPLILQPACGSWSQYLVPSEESGYKELNVLLTTAKPGL